MNKSAAGAVSPEGFARQNQSKRSGTGLEKVWEGFERIWELRVESLTFKP